MTENVVEMAKDLEWITQFKYLGTDNKWHSVDIKLKYPSSHDIAELEVQTRRMRNSGKKVKDSEVGLKILAKTIIDFPVVKGWETMNILERVGTLKSFPGLYVDNIANSIQRMRDKLNEDDKKKS